MHSIRLLAVSAAALTLISPLAVSAQDAEEAQATEQAQQPPEPPEDDSAEREALARQVFETGRTYFGRAEYERAAEAFREAYRLSGRAELLVNIARSLEALGRNEEAIEALEQAIEEDEALRSLAEPRLNRLRAQLRQSQGAAEADAEGGRDETDERPAAAGPGALFWGGVASAGAGVVLVAVSIGAGVASNDIYGDLEQSCPGRVCSPDRQDDIHRGHSLAVASTTTLVIGGAAAAAGVIMMLLDPGIAAQSEEPASAVEVTAGPGAVGVGLRARF